MWQRRTLSTNPILNLFALLPVLSHLPYCAQKELTVDDETGSNVTAVVSLLLNARKPSGPTAVSWVHTVSLSSDRVFVSQPSVSECTIFYEPLPTDKLWMIQLQLSLTSTYDKMQRKFNMADKNQPLKVKGKSILSLFMNISYSDFFCCTCWTLWHVHGPDKVIKWLTL